MPNAGRTLRVSHQRGNRSEENADPDEPEDRLGDHPGEDRQPISAVPPKLRRSEQQVGAHRGNLRRIAPNELKHGARPVGRRPWMSCRNLLNLRD